MNQPVEKIYLTDSQTTQQVCDKIQNVEIKALETKPFSKDESKLTIFIMFEWKLTFSANSARPKVVALRLCRVIQIMTVANQNDIRNGMSKCHRCVVA